MNNEKLNCKYIKLNPRIFSFSTQIKELSPIIIFKFLKNSLSLKNNKSTVFMRK